jgi:hypothetical protein
MGLSTKKNRSIEVELGADVFGNGVFIAEFGYAPSGKFFGKSLDAAVLLESAVRVQALFPESNALMEFHQRQCFGHPIIHTLKCVLRMIGIIS